MKVIIMAGGKGTRIASVKSDVPKPMIPIAGKAYSGVADRMPKESRIKGDVTHH